MADASISGSRVRVFICCAAAALFLAVPWFFSAPLHLDTFAGDDFQMWQAQKSGTYASTFSQCFTENWAGKYRPIADLAYLASWKICGDNFRGYVIGNVLLYSLIAGIIGVFLAEAGGGIPALAFTLIFATSRYANYHIFMRLGIMEQLAVLFLSLAILWGMRFYQSGKTKFALLAAVSFFLCIHTHERYVAVFPFLSLIFLVRADKDIKTRLELAAIPALIVLLNVLEKKYLLNVRFMTGTAGTQITINYHSIANFMRSGFLSVMGFHHGPAAVSGYDFRELPGHLGYWPGILMSAAFSVVSVCYVVYRGRMALMPALLFTALLGCLLLSASVTVGQGTRFLFPCSLVVVAGMLGMSTAVWRHVKFGVVAKVALALFLSGAIFANALARRNMTRIFFINWLFDAESARSTIVEGYKNKLEVGTVYLVNTKNIGLTAEYIRAYAGKNVKVTSIDDYLIDSLPSKEAVSGVFAVNNAGIWRSAQGPAPGAGSCVNIADDEFLVKARESIARSGNWYHALQTGGLFMSPAAAQYLRKSVKLEAAGPVCADALSEYYLRESIRLIGTGNPYPYFTLGQLYQRRGQLDKTEEYYCLAEKYDDRKNPNPALARACSSLKVMNEQKKEKK